MTATQKVTFVDTPHRKTANCVVYRPTKYQDIRPIGDLWSLFPSSAAGEPTDACIETCPLAAPALAHAAAAVAGAVLDAYVVAALAAAAAADLHCAAAMSIVLALDVCCCCLPRLWLLCCKQTGHRGLAPS